MINPMDMTGRRVLITGASSGIGRETAILLSQLGAKLIVSGRSLEKLDNTLSLLEGEGHFAQPLDLLSAEDIPIWLKDLAKTQGPLHGLVHSAGIQVTQPLRNFKRTTYDQVMQTNVTSAFELIKGFRQKGVCTPKSSVVLLSSTAAFLSNPGLSIYSASKGALVSLVKSLAAELANEGITVNCVAPAFVKTSMFDDLSKYMTDEQIKLLESKHLLGIGSPRDVAYSIAFLLADTGRWITGSTLVIDGGLTAEK